MNPQDAIAVVNRIKGFFNGISQADRELLERLMERYPLSAVEAVLDGYAQGATTFDRAKFRMLVREEYARCAPTLSRTPQWKEIKEAETKIIGESLNRLSKRRMQELLNSVREKKPEVFQFMRSDPLQTDFGRALLYEELKMQRSH